MRASFRQRAFAGTSALCLALIAGSTAHAETFDELTVNGNMHVLGTVFMNNADQTAILIGDIDDTVAIVSNTLSLADGDWSIAADGTAAFASINGMTITESEDGFSVVGGLSPRELRLHGGDLTMLSSGATELVISGSGEVVLLDAAQNLVNKTLTSPTLITSDMGVATATSLNGVALSALADGFSVAGGTASRALAITGGNITLTAAGATDVTLPLSGTLSTLTGTETLSNKTLTNAGNITTAAGSTVAVTADKLTVGGAIVPQHLEVSFTGTLTSLLIDQAIFVANRPYRVVAVRQTHGVASLLGSSVQLVKDTGTGAAGTGIDFLTNNSGAGFNLQSTINTVQNAVLSSTPSDLVLAAGDRLSVDFGGTLGSAAGVTVTVSLERI